MNKETQEVVSLIADLGWDYERLSSSGQQVYDKICKKIGLEAITEEDE